MMDELKPEGIPVQADTFSTTGIMAAAPSAEQSAAFVQAALGQQQEEAPQEEAVSPQTPQSVAANPTQDPAVKDAKERNFRAMRQEAERAQRERDEALRRLEEYERRYAKPAQQPEPDIENDIDLNIKDDDLVEGKQIKAAFKKLAAQQKEFQKRAYESTAESRLRMQYPDFDKVMTVENMKTLQMAYPELANSVGAGSDVYDKAVSVYTLIKKFGIFEEQPLAAEKERIIANTAKPKPLASIAPQQGDTPLSRANAFAGGLTEELKMQLRKEMAEAIRKY
jgi:hypothetical protein